MTTLDSAYSIGDRTQERLQKVLAQWGVASRRQAEALIHAGRISVNQCPAHVGQKVNPAIDCIALDGVILNPTQPQERLYLLLNKPAGVVSTCRDRHAHRTVLDLLPDRLSRGTGLHPVGRLDSDSTGALILTNDGTLTYHLTHPRHHIPKTYRVWVHGYPSEAVLEQWRCGVWLGDRETLPAAVTIIQQHTSHKTLLEIVLYEGRNRQIRRVAEQLGYPVLTLHRIAIGDIYLRSPGQPELPSGQYRPLSNLEICFLNAQIDLTSNMERELGEECKL